MPHASVNGIEIYYESHGSPEDDPLLLVMGLGAQMVAWDVGLVDLLVDHGFFVTRFDNRDVGLSTKFESDIDPLEAMGKVFGGGEIDAPYLLADMAADAVGLLDHLGIDAAHIVGASMGGMIVQQMAIDHPHRVHSVTSVMSTTGDPDVGAPTADALTALAGTAMTPVNSLEDAVAQGLAMWHIVGSPDHFDEEAVIRRVTDSYERDADGTGMMRQLIAVMASPSRTEGLKEIDLPSLVVHGRIDPLVQLSGGERTAEALGGEFIIIDDMAHDVPQVHWSTLVEAVRRVADQAKVG